MSTHPLALLVCDDSSMARKQLIRALPADALFQITHASNGLDGLDSIRKGRGEVVLLDLTMPQLDGFGVLAQIQAEGLACQVIVVSADVQDEAIRRARALGAKAFIKKPADPLQLNAALDALNIDIPVSTATRFPSEQDSGLPDVPFRDAFREVANIAMGRAAELLARVLGVFITLPSPTSTYWRSVSSIWRWPMRNVASI